MLPLTQLPSPNFGSRNGAAISMLVLHYTGMKTAEDALTRLTSETAQVSSHYVVDEEGTIYQLVDESQSAWHAGISYWRGNTNVNTLSIGIEIVNPGHEFGYRSFPMVQMHAVSELCKDIIQRNPILPVNVVGHSDIAPTRKEDPGELFDWQWLARQGVGLWPEIKSQESRGRNQEPGEKLAAYGYENPINNEHLRKIILAFQRHFRPQALTGEWDEECHRLLAALQEMV